MLKYHMIKDTETEMQYQYFPEGGNDYGVVSYEKESMKCRILSVSKNDMHQRYALKMFKKIREFASDGFFKPEGIVAWY